MSRSLARCAHENVVIGTVASADFAPPLLWLAASAVQLGFACVIVQPMDSFQALADTRLLALPLPPAPLLPEPQWCRYPDLHKTYGWRRSQFYKVRMWMRTLRAPHGLDLLAMDCDWRISMNPVPLLRQAIACPASSSGYALKHKLITPDVTRSSPAKQDTARKCQSAEVVAMHDGSAMRMLKVTETCFYGFYGDLGSRKHYPSLGSVFLGFVRKPRRLILDWVAVGTQALNKQL